MAAAIPSPPANGFHVGPFDVHAYGVMYALALVAAVAITVRRWEAVGGSRRLVYEVAAWGFPAGIVGGRLYFDITSANLVPDHWWGPFAIWDGGLGIWGGIAAGTLAGLVIRGDGEPTSRGSSTRRRRRCSSPRRSGGSATTSTRSCSALRPAFPGASRSRPRTARPATRRSPPSSRRSSTS